MTNILRRSLLFALLFQLALFPVICGTGDALADEPKTIVVTAEGLADANAETYKRDKGLMIDDLREDARRQAVEKAVGVYVDSSTLVENYTLIQDKVLTQTKGIIKSILKESPPWIGQDGFAHLLIKAEVYLGEVEEVLEEMTEFERVNLVKEHGNPRIAVAITIKDAKRGTDVEPERSPVAENILKERIKSFGYRVWSLETSEKLREEQAQRGLQRRGEQEALSAAHLKSADFTILGDAKFKTLAHKLPSSGITVEKFALTSWSVKCVDNHTGEEIYFNNQIPKKQSWADEDAALEDIGKTIGEEFSKEFFEDYLSQNTRIFEMHVLGLPTYDVGQMLKKEFIGLRPVINIDLKSFDASGLSVYEIEFAGDRGELGRVINSSIIEPLNNKLGEPCFQLISAHGSVVEVRFESVNNSDAITARFQTMPPASLVNTSAQRLNSLVKDPATKEKVAGLNPAGFQEQPAKQLMDPQKSLQTIQSF